MFIDRARIFVKGGDGGDGMSTFRREKFVARGGPNGGDGGRGGDVMLIVDNNINTLLDFRYKRQFKAERGTRGGSSNCFGKCGETMYVKVPPGTIVRDEDSDAVMADLTEDGQTFVVARGGRGGRGNAKFVTSVHRAPTFAEKGEPGEERWLRLELKLLADAGLVGYPSVGKSSILARVSAAKPEVAAYHFTTLSPILGVVSLGEGRSFVLADIPGLIEGAHEGVGLGHDFLRHIERTKVIVHVLDVSGFEGRDPLDDYAQINKELQLYNERLAKRPQIIAANKIDIPESRELLEKVTAWFQARGQEVYPISAATGEGIDTLMNKVGQMVDEYIEEPVAVEDVKKYEARPEEEFTISRDDAGTFIVEGRNIEKLVAMINFDDDEGLRRFQLIWRRLGIEEVLRAKGIKEGDIVHIRDMEFEYKE